VKVTLHRLHCYGKTESDEDEIYCVVTTGGGAERREVARIEVGKFEIGEDIRPDKLVWNGPNLQDVTITIMESDANEPARGSDDFIGEIKVSTDGNCRPGNGTLDEGHDESKRYRQFSMTGSGAHYVAQLEVQA
jgi:hypothetical protein